VPPTLFVDEPPREIAKWLERRHALGQDRRDEVWEGAYHVVPAAHSRHGFVVAQVAERLGPRARRAGLWPVGEVNIGLSEHDFRVPDYAVIRDRNFGLYLPTAAVIVEIISAGDESYQKFGFYFAHGVEEVLIVDPQRRTVEWYARGADAFARSGRSALLDVDEATLHGEIDWPPS
jgi:Uma2 family endonuclease